MQTWTEVLNEDPRLWLLEDENPAVKHVALQALMGESANDSEFQSARAAAMSSSPIAGILAAQHPEGYWVKPGPGYGPKYTGTVWQLIFLGQLVADGSDERVRTACDYVLSNTQTASGGFGAFGGDRVHLPAPSSVIHCLNGNLLVALIRLGWLENERVQRAIDWQARAITGEGFSLYYKSGTSGPNFCCAANEGLPCAWGAVKVMLALASIPAEKRPPHVQRAIAQGLEFLLSRDPLAADYPMGWGNTKPNQSWFKLGFPSGYVTDVLQNLEVLCMLGFAKYPRMQSAVAWLLSKQDGRGRWKNEYAYSGKMVLDIEKQGQSSKWVTLRACRVLKAVFS